VASSGPAGGRLLIAEDHDLVREGLRMLLEDEPGLRVVGEAADGQEAVDLCRRLEPDLVLMDVRMPRMDGLEATRAIKAEHPATSVLMVTAHEDPDYLLEAVRAGAAGYVLKDASRAELIDAVRRVLDNEPALDRGLGMRLLRRLVEEADARGRPDGGPSTGVYPGSAAAALPHPLTPREEEVLRLMATGRTNRQLAGDLHLSLSTVKRHMERIISKLGVSDRTQAAVRAIELGLLPATNRNAG
jgi:DNA-binding NarL/FixJ family response regulator